MSHPDLITISSSVLPDDVRVAAFRGREALSTPYEIELFLTMNGHQLDLADAIGGKACLTIDRANDSLPPFYFSGVLATVELLHEMEDRSLVRAVLVPRLWLLGLSRHSRIFTRVSIVDVIKTVLEDNAIRSSDVELRLGSHPKEEHICQYRESDLAFLSRWMEREGIFYYFEHGEDGEKLILCDSKAYDPIPVDAPVRFVPQTGGDSSAGASFWAWKCRHETLPTRIKIRDYDYAKPNLDVSGSAKVSDAGAGEVFLYGERFFSPDDGARIAKLRAEEMLAREIVHFAKGTAYHMRPGYTFELEDHPRDAFNAKYLAVETRHWGNQFGQSPLLAEIEFPNDHPYFVEVDAIPASTQFRAAKVTPWPRIYGFENGVVDGPADSEYAQIDDQGRYAVKFKFDESALKNGGASTFVRMMQPHGGGIEGFHFPLRKATEVVFSFMGGDPDRPVISGVVPNALTPSPVTSGNHTKNVIQTGGRNRLEIEDQKDQQRITLQTPYSNTYIRMGSPNDGHELIVHTEDNTWLNAGANLFVDAGLTKSAGFCQFRVQDDYKSFVEKGNYSLTVRTGTFYTDVKGDSTFQVHTGNWKRHIIAGTSTTIVHGKNDYTVEAGAFNQTVTGGDTTINNTAGQTFIQTQTKMGLDVRAGGVDIFSTALWHGKTSGGSMLLEAPAADVTIVSPAVTIDTTTFTDKSNDHKSWYGQHSSFATGKWTFLKGGEYFELGASAKIEISASIKLALSLALSLECNFGLSIKNKVGPAEITYRNASIKAVNLWFKNSVGPIVESGIVRLQRAGVHIATG